MTWGGGKRGGFRGASSEVKKPENPKDAQRNTMRCVSCQSIRHLLEKCPDSYENLKKFCKTILALTN